MKPALSICENKGADQLLGYRATDQSLCFHYLDSKIYLLPRFKISSLSQSSVDVQPCLCRTLLETLTTGFLATWLTIGPYREKHVLGCVGVKTLGSLLFFYNNIFKITRFYDLHLIFYNENFKCIKLSLFFWV